MGISTTVTGVGGWTVGAVVGRRPAGVARDAVHPGSGARAVLVVVDDRFTGRGLPDAETVGRAAAVGSPAVMPMLDAGLLDDGTRWYVTPPAPGPVLDPGAGCSPRRAASIVESVARALAAVHEAGLVHGLVGARSIVPAQGRHAERPVSATLLLDTGVAPLLGGRAAVLAQASGVSLPADRGPEADVHALGAVLLRLLTAAAPAGPALAALPAALRELLSAMLDDEPANRPTAAAVALRLAGMREVLLGTGPIDVPVSSRPAPTAALVPAAVVPAAPVVVPAPVPAPLTLESPIVVPRGVQPSAPSLWTGPVVVPAVERPRRRALRRVAVLAGGVGIAGLLIGVATHLPLGHGTEERALAAPIEGGVLAGAATGSPSLAVSTAAAPTTTSAPASASASARAAIAPAASGRSSSTSASSGSTAPTRATSASATPKRSTATSSASPSRTTTTRASSTPVATSTPTGTATGTAAATTPAASSSSSSTTPPTTPSSPPATSTTTPPTATSPAASTLGSIPATSTLSSVAAAATSATP
ncbi:hypothetical protein [Amnibacterium sp.]|uniref:hypothetical protein n=1 Tax=Amnibacterium sp. TaxID=1872496 RepID=UPI003F7BA7B5